MSCVVSTYLYGEFDCMFLSYHVRVSEGIYTVHFTECQGTPCPKQTQYLKFKWTYRPHIFYKFPEKFLFLRVLMQKTKNKRICRGHNLPPPLPSPPYCSSLTHFSVANRVKQSLVLENSSINERKLMKLQTDFKIAWCSEPCKTFKWAFCQKKKNC